MASVLLFRQPEAALDAALTMKVDGDVEGYRLQGPLLTFPLPDSLDDISVLAPASSAQDRAANGAFFKVPHQSRRNTILMALASLGWVSKYTPSGSDDGVIIRLAHTWKGQ